MSKVTQLHAPWVNPYNESPTDVLASRLEQIHGLLFTLYMCREDDTGEFRPSPAIVRETLDAACELSAQANKAFEAMLDERAAKKGGAK